ncbi:MAG: Maf family protein, partial [Candidatus Puniceispirillaceae bacterium]
RVYGGLCLITPDGVTRCRLSVSMVKFKQLSQNELNAYLEGGEWDGKAGGYAIQGQAEQFISMISGSYANIMGFDVHVISGMLGAIGFCHQP